MGSSQSTKILPLIKQQNINEQNKIEKTTQQKNYENIMKYYSMAITVGNTSSTKIEQQNITNEVIKNIENEIEKINKIKQRKINEIKQRKINKIKQRKINEIEQRKINEIEQQKIKEIKQQKINEIEQQKINEINTTCCVCLNEISKRIVLIPCGHADICSTCVEKLHNSECPTCRAKIANHIHIYL